MEFRELENLKVLEGKIQRRKSIENFMMKKHLRNQKSLNSEFSVLRSQERIEESNETQEGIFFSF